MDRKRTAALNAHEVSVLIDLLESRPDLISGKLGGSYPNVAAVRMAWEEVASQLNILGSGVIRTGLEIKKKWIDLKYRTKRKASEINQATLQTGGGPPSAQKLSDVELKIMALIGRTCVEGVCGQEFDSTYVQLKEVPVHPSTSKLDQNKENIENDYIFNEISTNEEIHLDTPAMKSKKNALSTPRVSHLRKKRTQEVETEQKNIQELISLHRETVTQLKEINQTLKVFVMMNCIKNVSYDDLLKLCEK